GAESVARHLDVEHPPALSIEPRCVRQLRLDSARQTGRSVDLREPLLAIGRNRLGDCHHNTPDGRDGARGLKLLRRRRELRRAARNRCEPERENDSDKTTTRRRQHASPLPPCDDGRPKRTLFGQLRNRAGQIRRGARHLPPRRGGGHTFPLPVAQAPESFQPHPPPPVVPATSVPGRPPRSSTSSPNPSSTLPVINSCRTGTSRHGTRGASRSMTAPSGQP